MKTNPTVSRFVDRVKVTIQPNTRAKADEEAQLYIFTRISRGHHACTHKDTTHVIIERDGTIGCSCGDMTYRCTGTNVCKHIAGLLGLKEPPQIPAPSELIQKLSVMGWVGGKDDFHPAELLSRPGPNPDDKEPIMVHYECPKCGEVADVEAMKLRDWKLEHMDTCAGTQKTNRPEIPDNNTPKEHQKTAPSDPLHDGEDPEYPEQAIPELPEPPSEDYSSCVNVEHENPLLTSKPPAPPSPESVPSNLATALCNMQMTALSAVADSNNPFHNAKYADLSSVWAAIRKPLTDNGLAILQTTEPYPKGITVITTLMHTSGESISTRISAEVPTSKPDKNGQVKPNIQGLGSTITYLRRYSLSAMVGAVSVDDDGESAMGR